MLTVARLTQIVFDSRLPSSIAAFWAATLDDFHVRPYDDAEIARLAQLGYTPATDPSVILDGPNGLEICFQQVDESVRTKRPVHLDLCSDDWEGEVERLVDLGATLTAMFESHAWMKDPDGNDFCIVSQ